MGKHDQLSRGRRLKLSILASFAAVVCFVMAAFLVTVYVIEQQTRERELAARLHAVEALLHQKVDKEAGLMHAVVMALSGNAEVEAAFATTDRSALARLIAPLFEDIRTEHGITHLYFTDGDLVNILRLHERRQYGDIINRHTTLRARDTGETMHGVELGPLGTLTLRMVTPWRQGERLLGYVELGQEIESLLEDTAGILGVDLVAFVDKRYLARGPWERGQSLLGREGRWEQFPAFALVAQTMQDVPPAVRRRFTEVLNGGEAAEVKVGGRSFFVAGVPLPDAADRPIGRILVVQDVTEFEATFRNSLAAAMVVSILAGGLVFFSFRKSLARVEADYRGQHDLEHQLLRMSADHQRMVQVEKLSAVGTMMGEIAHQLNNPLVGVVNMAQLAERHAEDPARVRSLLAEIRRAGQDCRAFVQRMLGFTKVSCFDPRPTEVATVIEEAVALFHQSAGRRVAVELRTPEPAVVFNLDPILLRHAIFNLLANAGQAMGGAGSIRVAVEPAAADESGRSGWFIAVEDEGPGLPDDVREKLFTPFFTTRAEGTGLGLPVVLHVALLHEGRVEAANRPEGGARFAIWLPNEEGLVP